MKQEKLGIICKSTATEQITAISNKLGEHNLLTHVQMIQQRQEHSSKAEGGEQQ